MKEYSAALSSHFSKDLIKTKKDACSGTQVKS